MAELLFHHAHGRTSGVVAFADQLRGTGHTVHVPDLYDGRTFDELEAGMGYAQEVGFGTIVERGVHAAEGLPAGVVYAGFSLGAMPAQRLAQLRPGAAGALLFSACVPSTSSVRPGRTGFPSRSTAWTPTRSSPARETSTPRASSCRASRTPSCSYDESAARVLTERVIAFLDTVG